MGGSLEFSFFYRSLAVAKFFYRELLNAGETRAFIFPEYVYVYTQHIRWEWVVTIESYAEPNFFHINL